MESIWGMRARSDDEVVARDFDVAVRIADFCDVNRHQLRSFRLLEVGDLLAEAKLNIHFSALLVQEFDEFACCTAQWSAK